MNDLPDNIFEMEVSNIDINSICRVCRSKSNLVNIFTANAIIDIPTEIYNLTSVKIARDDNLPQKICFRCVNILNTCVSFKTICIQTKKFFEENLGIKGEYIEITTKVEGNQTDDELQDFNDNIFDIGQDSDGDDKLLVELNEFIKDKNPAKNSDSDICQNDLDSEDKLLLELQEFVKDKNTTRKSDSDKNSDSDKTSTTIKKDEDVDEYHEDFLTLPTIERSPNYHKKLAARIRKLIYREDQNDKIEKHVDLLLQREENKLNNQNDYAKKMYARTRAPIKCEYCCLFLATKDDLIDHLRRIKHAKVYRQSLGTICKHCDNYVEPGKMKQHLQAHYKSKFNDTSICDICGKLIKHGNMKRHKYVHLENQERPFRCDICNKGFTQKGFFEDHMNTHSGSKPYMCDVCGKSFSQHSQFYQHIKYQHGHKKGLKYQSTKPKKPKVDVYKCDICDKILSNLQSFKEHLAVHGVEYLQCTYCDKLFATESQLKTHMVHHARHSDKTKTYVCKICDREFTGSLGLRNHMRVHDDVRSHVCTECGKAFHHSSNLFEHLRTHTGEKKQQKRSTKTIVRMPKLTEEQLYDCSYCSKTFPDTGSLRRHFWKKHRNQYKVSN